MGLRSYIGNYLVDKEYKITIRHNSVNIVNYSEIKDFSNDQVTVRYNDQLTKISGDNLVITQMLDDEILITGNIIKIEL